jgi:hypothetical protein
MKTSFITGRKTGQPRWNSKLTPPPRTTKQAEFHRTLRRLAIVSCMDWIGQDHVLFLTGVPQCEPNDLARLVETVGLRASITTRYQLVEHEIKHLLLEKGVSYLWQLVNFREDVLPRTPDRPALLRVLVGMLGRIAPTEELVIVDRYLLPKGCTDCLNTLAGLIAPILPSGARIVLVTSQQCDAGLVDGLRERLKDSKGEVELRISENFHDRFWIADRSRGLFVGTSLNGLGKRYALADYMDEDDVKVIVDALSGEGLLP